MKKKGSGELIEKVYSSVKAGPKSIKDVADDVDTNWESARNALELLAGLDLVAESEKGNKRVFRLKEPGTFYGGEVLFGLPLSKDQDNVLNYLFMRIRRVWSERTGFSPNRSQVQKVAVNAIEDCGLVVPVGWYKFGMLSVKAYDPSIDYSYDLPVDSERIDECIDAAVNFYRDCLDSASLKNRQYLSKKNELYQLKEELVKMAYLDFSEKNRLMLRQQLTDFAFSFPLKEDNREIVNVLNDIVRVLISILKNNDEASLCSCRTDMVSGFDALWDMVATYMFYDSLKEYYSKDVLDAHIRSAIDGKKAEVLEHLEDLEGCVKPVPIPDFKGREIIDKIRGSIPARPDPTQEERDKILAEFVKEVKSKSLGKDDSK